MEDLFVSIPGPQLEATMAKLGKMNAQFDKLFKMRDPCANYVQTFSPQNTSLKEGEDTFGSMAA